MFNPISVFRHRIDCEKCVKCGTCAKICDMGCDPVKNPNALECIRCGKCKKACPAGAIYSGFREKTSRTDSDKN